MSMEQIYNEKVNRILTTSNHEEPDIVPVISLIDTWAISYANSTINECLADSDNALKEIYPKCFQEIYCDAAFQKVLSNNMKFYDALGVSRFFVSEDGTTLQHKEGVTMDAEDYPDLIKDPFTFLATKLYPRKYPGLTVGKMVKASQNIMPQQMFDQKYFSYFKEELGVPILIGGAGAATPPLDFLFDFLRGFKGISIDIRKRPQQVFDAMEAIFPICDSMLGIQEGERKEPWPFVFTMLHIPTYISHATFLKFFVPLYEKIIYKAHASGVKLVVFLEGEWEKHYDWLNSLPKNFVIALVEHDDFIKAKKKIGQNVTIMGGMPLDLLKYQSKEKCIDYVKRIVDECAPGGGFIFSTDKILLSKNDVNAENYRAVNEFVHEYGVYK